MVSSESARLILASALQAHVGLGPSREGGHSFQSLALTTGISESRLYKMARGELSARLPEMFALLTALPPSFTNMIIEPTGSGGAHELAKEYPAFGLPVQVNEFSYHFDQRLYDDGRFCQRDVLELTPMVRLVHEYAGAWLNKDTEKTEKVEADQ